MPRGQFDALRLELVDGDRVHVYGRPELFEARGDFRLRALSIERFGLGEHLAAIERLRKRLAAEGLFAADRKRALPRLPRRIGLVTGNDAAAKRDVLTAITARFPPARRARRRDVRAGAAGRAGDRRSAGGDLCRARSRRRRARSRRRQLRGPAAVQRRAARPRGGGLAGAGGFRGRDTSRTRRCATSPRTCARRRRPRPHASSSRTCAELVALLDRARAGSHAAPGGSSTGAASGLGRARTAGSARRRRLLVERRRGRLDVAAAKLRALSPQATLERGYAIVRGEAGVIRSAPDVAAGDPVRGPACPRQLRRAGRGGA